MPWLITSWCINAVVGIALAAMLVVLRRRHSLKRWLANVGSSDASAVPSFSVVIAARNEEEAVERTLREFATLPGVAKVILVDDGSEDNTLQIARSIAAGNSRVRVLEAPPLPQGWIGKTHAIHWASKFVRSDYILFTDADVYLHQLPIQEILLRMEKDALDHVGGMFRFCCNSSLEKGLGACYAVVAFYGLATSAYWGSGAATGAFNLIKRSAYLAMDGHATVKYCIMDDVALARCVITMGFQSKFVDLSPCVMVNLYEGVHGFCSSVSRLSVSFLPGKHAASVSMLIGLVVILSFFATILLPLMSVLANGCSFLEFGIVLLGYMLITMPFLYGHWLTAQSAVWGLVAPISLIFTSAIVVRSGASCLLGKNIVWRNREYTHFATGHTRVKEDSNE